MSKYTAGTFTAGTTTLGATDGVQIRYAPTGVASACRVSTVNPNGPTAVQLRACDTVASEFNPFQAFHSAAAVGGGTFVSFGEVINNYALTNPKGNGSIGVKGHRVHVITASYTGRSGQLRGRNGA